MLRGKRKQGLKKMVEAKFKGMYMTFTKCGICPENSEEPRKDPKKYIIFWGKKMVK